MTDAAIDIGEFRLDADAGVLRHGTDVVALRPKTFAFLCHLARNRGRVVTKDELFQAVWPGVYVSEDSLTQCVSELRKRLGGAGCLKTVPKRGYLLAAEPAALGPVGTAYPTIAVLPFRNLGSDEGAAPLLDAIAEEITYGLARFKTIVVIDRNSAFSFPPDSRPPPSEIGARLGADFLVDGSARHAEGRLGVSVSLSHAAGNQRLWGQRFDVPEAELFTMNATIAGVIISRLIANIDSAVLQPTSVTRNLAAYQDFVRGVSLLRGYGPGVNERGRDHFLRAIEADPDFALAHAYLGLAEIIVGDYGAAPRAVLERARDRAALAIALQPEEARCHRIMGLAQLYLRQHAAAESALRRAHEINPYDADALAQLGFVATMRSRPEEGLAWVDRAIALNPLRPYWYDMDRSYALYALGRYDEALAIRAGSPDQGPFHCLLLAASHAMAGQLERAARLFSALCAQVGDADLVDLARQWTEFEHEADVDHLIEGLKLAEGAAGTSRFSR